MNNGGKRLNRITSDQHIHLDHFRRAITGMLVVHGTITTRHRLQLVVEIHKNFSKWQNTRKHHSSVINGFGVSHVPTFFKNQLHHVTNVFTRHHDVDIHDRFTNLHDALGIWK